MRYIEIGGQVVPKHCIYGPRQAEGIVFNNYEWWSITDHLVKEQREREMAAVCRAKEEAKRDLSFQMTSNWSNTLASIKTQGNQKRLEKMEREKQDRIDQYHQIMKNRTEDKKKILESVKKKLYLDKDEVKTINSAVWFSTVLDGRRKQIEMSNALKREEAKKEEELMLQFKREAEEEERAKLQEKLKTKADRNIRTQQYEAQMAALKKKKEAEAEEFRREKEDLLNMTLEGERIHRCNMVEKEWRRHFAEKFVGKTEQQLELERTFALEQEEEDEINRIYKKYERKFKKERREREERIKNEAVERRVKISEMLAQKLRENATKDEEIFQSALKEREEQARREEEEKKEKERQILDSLLEGKKKAEEARARRRYEERERQKWEFLQLCRSAEINEERKRLEKEREQKETEKMVAALDCQRKHAEAKRAEELKERLESLEDEAAEKEELIKYCEETMKFVTEHNLPEAPVKAAIAEVKKLHGIVDKEQKELEQRRRQKEAEQQETKKPKPLGKGCYCLKY